MRIPTREVLAEIVQERFEQDEKWGVQDHLPAYWMTILMEEVGEASKNVLEAYPHKHPILKKSEALKMWRKEMIQVAAVAVAAAKSKGR